ncbi:MAG: hypothetical protein ACFFCI_02265 [Promethearchaeota archaeon]
MAAYHQRLIANRLSKSGVDPQTVDIKAEYDSRLTYKENLRNFEQYTQKNRAPSRSQQIKFRFNQLLKRHSQRSKRSQIQDEKQRHPKTKSVNKMTSKEVDQWYDDPGQSDIKGIDTPEVYQRRRLKLDQEIRAKRLERRLPSSGTILSRSDLHSLGYSNKDIEKLKHNASIGQRRKNEFIVV